MSQQVMDSTSTVNSVTPSSQSQSASNTIPSEVSSSRVVFVEPIRAYAMSIVVFIHVASILAPHYNTIPNVDWWISNMYHAFSKGGPPIFTMISGMLLLTGKDEQPIGEFFKKRFMKVLIPFLGWAVIYLIWRITFQGEVLSPHDMLNAVLNGPVYYHLWFIQMILGLYLATPILRVYVRHASRANLRYFLLVWFITTTCLPVLQNQFNLQIGINFVVTTNYVGYFVMGYYLRDFTLKPRQLIPDLFIVVGTLLATEYAVHDMTVAQDGALDTFYLNNLGFNMVIVSVGMFLFLKSLPWMEIYQRFTLISWAVKLLASCSLGVYFVHVLIMEAIGSGRFGITINSQTFSPLIGIPLTAIVTLVLSVAIILVIKRVPLLKVFVP